MQKKPVFKLFADCKLVRGANKSLIYDLNRRKLYKIDNEIAVLLESCIGKSKRQIIENHPSGIQVVLEELIKNDIGFFTDEPERFIEIDEKFNKPSKIYSAILEIDKKNSYNVVNAVILLNDLQCKSLLLSFCNTTDWTINEIEELLALTSDSFFTNIELILPYRLKGMEVLTDDFFKDHLRITSVLYFNSPYYKVELNSVDVQITYVKDKAINWDEQVDLDYFTTNLISYVEAKQFNIGLNRKVCLNKYGEVKNYLTHIESFGNILEDNLMEIIEKPSFQQKWKVSNDLIEHCNICEFRYCCLSNSDLKHKDNKWYKLNYCNDKTLN